MFDEQLVVVGTGIRTVGQLTLEAIAWMERADRLFYVVSDPVAEEALHQLNPKGAESLSVLYAEGKPRIETYNAMIERLLESVRSGALTVGAFYGHPGVFAYPSHESVRRARQEGYRARMLPGISAEDCLFADLGVDPAMNGCQSYDATDFLLSGRVPDVSSQVILWQIGFLGNWTYEGTHYDLSDLPLLVDRLAEFYPATHPVVVYEAATLPGCEPVIRKIPLRELTGTGLTGASTLYIAPARTSTTNPALLSRMHALRSAPAAAPDAAS